MDIINKLLPLSTAIAALIVGLAVYKHLIKFYRLLFFQVLIYLLIDCLSIPFMPNNSWVLNIFVPMETALLFAAAQIYFDSTKSKYLLLLIYSLFVVIYLLDLIFITGINKFVYHAAIAEGICISVLYIIILYIQFNRRFSLPLTFACLGLILYFACSIPYISTLFYFQKIDPILNQKLFQYIIVLLAHVRYSFIALAFFLVGKSTYMTYVNKNPKTI